MEKGFVPISQCVKHSIQNQKIKDKGSTFYQYKSDIKIESCSYSENNMKNSNEKVFFYSIWKKKKTPAILAVANKG